MNAIDHIRAKRNGATLDSDALKFLVDQYTGGEMPDYQMSAFLMAVYFQGMTHDELGAWTDAMLNSGEVLDLSSIDGHKVDKHSTGGIGDKVSLILAPLAVAAGLKVPMISGRGLGHTGGTLDKLESIPGFNVNLTVDQFVEQVDKLGCGLIGQTGEIAPADKKLYALRDVTATVECIPLIASSIMSKKLAEGIDALVLDVKVGSGAFMKNIDDARELAKTMIGIGNTMGRPTRALITEMNQPLGRAIGNSLEVMESIDTLRGQGPDDLEELTIELVLEMLDVAGMVTDPDKTRKELHGYLVDDSAFEIFRSIVEAQGGDVSSLDDVDNLPTASDSTFYFSDAEGFLNYENVASVGLAAMELGAGRKTIDDIIDPAVGLKAISRRGDPVQKGEPLFEIFHNGKGVEECKQRLANAVRIDEEKPEELPLIYEKLS